MRRAGSCYNFRHAFFEGERYMVKGEGRKVKGERCTFFKFRFKIVQSFATDVGLFNEIRREDPIASWDETNQIMLRRELHLHQYSIFGAFYELPVRLVPFFL